MANRMMWIGWPAFLAACVLGHTPRVTEERVRVARALQDLPALAEALETGSVCWTAVRERTRVASGSPPLATRPSVKSNGW